MTKKQPDMKKEKQVCEWVKAIQPDYIVGWNVPCFKIFHDEDDADHYKFCPYCGKEIKFEEK